MTYPFPVINHIDDVLPHLDDDNFIVAKKEGYTVINYILPDNTTFPPVKTVGDAIRRECRGIIFDENGNISARRFHKFFNLGEREENLLENVDFDQPHIILEKLDGSMVTPFELADGTVVWGTKMGATDVAGPVADYVAKNPKYTDFAHRAFASGTTPIFEWVSPQQRIVLDYPEDQLILTAIRGTVSGWYMPYESMVEVAKRFDLPVVQTRFKYQLGDATVKPETFLELFGGGMEGEEGVVIRFDSGHMLKVKCEWYVRIHKNKELVSSEKNLVELIVNQQLDDVIPFLMEADREKVLKYQDEFHHAMKHKKDEIQVALLWLRTDDVSRKDFALQSENWNPMLRGTIFKLFDMPLYKDIIYEHLDKLVKSHCTSNQMFAKLKGWLLRDISYE